MIERYKKEYYFLCQYFYQLFGNNSTTAIKKKF